MHANDVAVVRAPAIGTHDRLVAVGLLVTVRANTPMLGPFESSRLRAEMETGDDADKGIYLRLQVLPSESAQVIGEKLPYPVLDQEIARPGGEFESHALQLTERPTVTLSRLHDTLPDENVGVEVKAAVDVEVDVGVGLVVLEVDVEYVQDEVVQVDEGSRRAPIANSMVAAVHS